MCPRSAAQARCALCGAKDVSEPRGEEKYCRDCWDKKIAVEDIVAREFAIKRYIRAHSAEKYLVYHTTQKRPCGQLIVVDDRSTDSTPDLLMEIAKQDSRLQVIRVDAVPPGWLGKCHACHVGSREASADWLLFMDADAQDIGIACDIGAERIELYTERYARAFADGEWQATLDEYAAAARRIQAAGLGVNAGHDLNLDNIEVFCTIPGILECSIGHALTAEALFMGLEATVGEYLKRMR